MQRAKTTELLDRVCAQLDDAGIEFARNESCFECAGARVFLYLGKAYYEIMIYDDAGRQSNYDIRHGFASLELADLDVIAQRIIRFLQSAEHLNADGTMSPLLPSGRYVLK